MSCSLRSASYASVVFAILILSTFSVGYTYAAPTVILTDRVHAGSSSSTNWSGYAITGGKGSVTYVRGSWVVPAIQGTCPATNQYSSFWVGIDGFSSNTVEQTGTDSDCQGGMPTYYAWFEFYPKPSYLIKAITVHPGDFISAYVYFSGQKFVVSIVDVTTGQSFSTSARVSSAQRSSAEWIAEAPSSSGGVLPLANFGSVYFGLDYTGIPNTNYATMGGVSKPLGSFGSSIQQITMVTGSGVLKAAPSVISSDGTSFFVQWYSSGP